MSLPLKKSYRPMEALPAAELPSGPEWQYEPKWDGFRCLAFRDGKRIELMSKSQKPLTRYFPELVAALGSLKAQRFVLDGEIVIPIGEALSFDQLLMRIHPAASRIQKLSEATPCVFLVFDLLVDEKGESVLKLPLDERRVQLEEFSRKFLKSNGTVRLSPFTEDFSVARKWFGMGTALDGVIAKRRDLSYQSGERSGMQKSNVSGLPIAWSEDFAILKNNRSWVLCFSGSTTTKANSIMWDSRHRSRQKIGLHSRES